MPWVAAVLASVAATVQCAAPAAERERQMSASYADFDTMSGAGGWRSLNARGSTDTALGLLDQYRSTNASRLTPPERREIAFHMAQALLMAGRRAAALPFLGEADGGDATDEWRAYVAAHVAWARGDRAALAAAHDAYRAAPGASADRLRFIGGFIKCPEQPYMASAMCG